MRVLALLAMAAFVACATSNSHQDSVTVVTSETVKSLPACSREECGPAPMYPNERCPDGVNFSGRGPCVRINGRCGWAHLACPSPQP